MRSSVPQFFLNYTGACSASISPQDARMMLCVDPNRSSRAYQVDIRKPRVYGFAERTSEHVNCCGMERTELEGYSDQLSLVFII
jgi:hypothetical protein